MKKPKKYSCPNCASTESAEIVYGLFDMEGWLKLCEKGDYALGGCCFSDDSPDRECKKCEHQWNSKMKVKQNGKTKF